MTAPTSMYQAPIPQHSLPYFGDPRELSLIYPIRGMSVGSSQSEGPIFSPSPSFPSLHPFSPFDSRLFYYQMFGTSHQPSFYALKNDREAAALIEKELGIALNELPDISSPEIIGKTLLDLAESLLFISSALPYESRPKSMEDIVFCLGSPLQVKELIERCKLENTKKLLKAAFPLDRPNRHWQFEYARRIILTWWQEADSDTADPYITHQRKLLTHNGLFPSNVCLEKTLAWFEEHKPFLFPESSIKDQEKVAFSPFDLPLTLLPVDALKLMAPSLQKVREISFNASSTILSPRLHEIAQSIESLHSLELIGYDLGNQHAQRAVHSSLQEWRGLESATLVNCSNIQCVLEPFQNLQGKKLLKVVSPSCPRSIFFHTTPLPTSKWFKDTGEHISELDFSPVPPTITESSVVPLGELFPSLAGQRGFFVPVMTNQRETAYTLEGNSQTVYNAVPPLFYPLLGKGISLLLENPAHPLS